MILIYSIPLESTTSTVISWLNFYGKTWRRINSIYFPYNSVEININNKSNYRQIGGGKLSEITAVWYRRNPYKYTADLSSLKDQHLRDKVHKNMFSEVNSLHQSSFSYLSDRYWLSHPDKSSINKIEQLEVATNCGLKIPDTLVTTSKSQLIKFNKKNKKIIIKAIQQMPFFKFEDENYVAYTQTVDDFELYPDFFFPVLAQQYIEKELEVRAFFLEDKFYSMAIFSQSDPYTKIDFRRVDMKFPNRMVCFQLPKQIEVKLRKFMKIMNLNTGSFDLILSKNNQYFFLEVNPVGQFGMVSSPCNYYLEKEVAELLIKKSQEYEQKYQKEK